MKGSTLLFLAGLAALPAFGGSYESPYGLVESGLRSDVRKELPVAINAVDGVNTISTRYPQPVSPGKHQVQIIFASDRLPSSKAFRVLDMDIEPCTRYRVVAAYETRVYLGTWQPKVYPEPIGEWQAKFGRSVRR